MSETRNIAIHMGGELGFSQVISAEYFIMHAKNGDNAWKCSAWLACRSICCACLDAMSDEIEAGKGSAEEKEQLKALFSQMGADEGQAVLMAQQMSKRAAQLSEERGMTRVEAMEHLLRIMISGWQGIPPEESSRG